MITLDMLDIQIITGERKGRIKKTGTAKRVDVSLNSFNTWSMRYAKLQFLQYIVKWKMSKRAIL